MYTYIGAYFETEVKEKNLNINTALIFLERLQLIQMIIFYSTN